ncbi:hypothetical protein N7G274_009119 [Stereocaulon virgatum]|uniref:Chromatin associated protein KTI12 n=1 Tax=Stereocaulon virgatum TaxID=373712 RepID=A0ABR3ZYT8_9LECA
MPLILISGYPSSGKTYRSNQLVEYFESNIAASADARISRLTVYHINDQSLGLTRDVYREARTEKDARATEYSAVKRALGKDTIVIADGLNYIKGFRYQLYCEAKAVQTPSCVVHVGTPIQKCEEINARLLESKEEDGGYVKDLFDNLVYRYEEPNGMTRWDSPLFTVPFDDGKPPLKEIWEAMIGSEGKAKVVKPNQATIMKPATESDYLYELDKASQEILNVILDWQKDHPGEGGGELAAGEEIIVLPANPVSLPQLQRLRRQYISLNRQHNLPKSRIRSSFIEYLNYNLG